MDNGILYDYLYCLIKKENKGFLIRRIYLIEIINRYLGRLGLPLFFKKEVINDLIKMRLIERKDFRFYKILNNKSSERRIKRLYDLYD